MSVGIAPTTIEQSRKVWLWLVQNYCVKKLPFPKIENMLILFFDSKEVVHKKKFVPEGQIVTWEFYAEVFGLFAEANCMCETRGLEESQFISPP